MSKLPLTFACGLYDRMLAMQTGEVQVEGVDLNFLVDDNPRNIFDRMAAGLEFDASSSPAPNTSPALSPATVRSSPSRCSPRGCSATASSSSTRSTSSRRRTWKASDRRAGLHHDGGDLHPRALSDEHGIDFSKNEWVEGDINSAKRHGNPTILPTAKKLSISANQSGKSLSKLLEEGELSAIIGTGVPEAFGRNPDIVRLYPDYRAAEMEYYKRTRIFPIMHTVVIRRDVHERHPFVASALYTAFQQSKDRRVEEDELPRHAAPHAAVDDGRARRDRRRCSAAIRGPTVSSRTARRSRRWCAISKPRASSPRRRGRRAVRPGP